MTLESIRSVPLFASLDDDAVRRLRGFLHLEEVAPSTLLFRAGDQSDAMYLIETGRVRISVADAQGSCIVLADLAAGDFFGEMATIDGKPRSADATVTEKARLARLSRTDFLEFIHGNPVVALKMLSAVSQRLRHTDELLRTRTSRNLNEEEKKQMTPADRVADVMARLAGSWLFILVSVCFIGGWMYLHSVIWHGAYDPAPYELLSFVLAVVAGLQAPIILMAQNRECHKDRLRDDLDYEINLKNELTLAEVLRRIDVLESERLPALTEELGGRLKLLETPGAQR